MRSGGGLRYSVRNHDQLCGIDTRVHRTLVFADRNTDHGAAPAGECRFEGAYGTPAKPGQVGVEGHQAVRRVNDLRALSADEKTSQKACLCRVCVNDIEWSVRPNIAPE